MYELWNEKEYLKQKSPSNWIEVFYMSKKSSTLVSGSTLRIVFMGLLSVGVVGVRLTEQMELIVFVQSLPMLTKAIIQMLVV